MLPTPGLAVMIARLDTLRRHPGVFRSLTGLSVPVFDALAADVMPLLAAADVARLDHPDRERAMGGGRKCRLGPTDQVLLAVVWLRTYPTDAVLAFLFGVSESAARRTRKRVVPVLAQAGRDGMRMPDPERAKDEYGGDTSTGITSAFGGRYLLIRR